MKLGGFAVNGSADKVYFPLIHNPSKVQLDRYLTELENKSGMLRLELGEQPDIGVHEITLHAAKGKYLPLLSEYTETGMKVRTLQDLRKENSLVVFELSGEKFPNRAITNDFLLVAAVLAEFLETGNVSVNLMA